MLIIRLCCFFVNDTATTEIYTYCHTLSLHAALPIWRVEVCSFVHAERVPQMADAEAVLAALPQVEGVTYVGLVLNRRGFERAADAGMDEINYVVIASDTFSQRNQGRSEERRVGKESVSTCRSRRSPYH